MRKSILLVGGLVIATLAIAVIVKFEYYEPLLYHHKTKSGLPYRKIRNGKGDTPQAGQFVLGHLRISKHNGSRKKAVLIDTLSMQNNSPMTLKYTDKLQQEHPVLHEVLSAVRPGACFEFKAPFEVLRTHFFKGRFAGLTHYLRAQQVEDQDSLYIQLQVETVLNRASLPEFFEAYAKQQQVKAAKASKAQIEKERGVIDDYIKEYDLTSQGELTTTKSGLRYLVTQPGTGELPAKGDTVSFLYVGKKLDGTVFDTNREKVAQANALPHARSDYAPLKLTVGERTLIEGMQEGVALLPKGAKAILIIPSPLAYGTHGAGGTIGKDEILIFDVEVLDITRQEPTQSDVN